MKKLAALKKVTDLRDCAMAYLDLARNSSMTGQAVAVGEFLTVLVLVFSYCSVLGGAELRLGICD